MKRDTHASIVTTATMTAEVLCCTSVLPVMKRHITALVILCLLAMLRPALAQPLTGTKTIGGVSPDYTTFADAVTALNNNGVGTGGVTFNFRDGTYAGGVTITATGTAPNPIVFQSESDDSSKVTISSSSADVITLQGCSYITFIQLTIDYTGSATYTALSLAEGYNYNNISITNCILDGVSDDVAEYKSSVIFARSTNNNNFVITNSTLRNGVYGIYMVGISGTPSTGCRIEGCEFIDNYGGGVYLKYVDAFIFSGNTIHSSKVSAINAEFTIGLYVYNCTGQNRITNNYIYTDGTGQISRGINLISSSATPGNNTLIANNSIQVYNNTKLSTGIYQSADSKHYDIIGNTIYISAGSSAETYPYFTLNGSDDTKVKNNIFMHNGTSATSFVVRIGYTDGISEMDHNCYYWSVASPYFRSFYGATKSAFSAHTAATGETHSLNIDPVMSFIPGVGWKATATGLTGKGEYLASIPTDIDGKNRVNPTTVGAHELGGCVTPATPTALAGSNAGINEFTANWDSVSDATAYILDVSTDSAFNSFVSGYDGLNVGNVLTKTVTGLPPGPVIYYYRVKANNSCGSGSYSNIILYSTLSPDTCSGIAAGAITASRDTSCEGTLADLQLSGSSGTVQWQSSFSPTGFTDISGADSTTYSEVLSADTYFRVVAGTGSCTDTSAALKITVNPSPVADFNFTAAGAQVSFTDNSTGATVYEWNFGDGQNSAEQNPVHDYTATGVYHVCLNVFNGSNCSFTTCKEVDLAVGMAAVTQGNRWRIYPNPVNNSFSITGENTSHINAIELYDVLGSSRFNKNFRGEKSSTLQVNISGLPEGVYYLHLKTAKENFVQPIIKIK